ncbi:MAG: ROK family transcriptional regulator [Jatrophihabitans sp.]
MVPATGGSLADLRRLNASTVLGVISRQTPISRAQISREVGLTRPTVSSALETLLEAGLVRQSQPADGKPHYGATFFQPAPDAAHFLAFDIDRRQLRAVLVDAVGTVAASLDSHRASNRPTDLVQQLRQVSAELCVAASLDQDRIALAVVGVPAAVDPRDGTLRLSAYRLLEGFALGPAISAELAVPVIVDNDVNLAAIGEHAAGAARDVSDFAYVTIGRNVGSGIVLRGEILRGVHGAAGEVDAPVTDAEHLAASPAADAFEALARAELGAATAFGPTPAAVFAAAGRGDQLAHRILTEQARRISEVVAVLCRVLDLSLVVLGGGIGRRCGPILAAIEQEVGIRVPFPPQLVISQLTQRPVLVGASTVGVRESMRLVTPRRLAQVIRRPAV